MTTNSIHEFHEERDRLNRIVMKYSGQSIKRFYSLDSQVYRPGALPKSVKEMMGLVASLVLRCDDCIKYHIIQCFESGINDEELEEALSIALIVGGSITIPHLRHALAAWDEMKTGNSSSTEKE